LLQGGQFVELKTSKPGQLLEKPQYAIIKYKNEINEIKSYFIL